MVIVQTRPIYGEISRSLDICVEFAKPGASPRCPTRPNRRNSCLMSRRRQKDVAGDVTFGKPDLGVCLAETRIVLKGLIAAP